MLYNIFFMLFSCPTTFNFFVYVVFMLYNIFFFKNFLLQHFNFQAATDTTDATVPATTSQCALAPARFSASALMDNIKTTFFPIQHKCCNVVSMLCLARRFKKKISENFFDCSEKTEQL